METKMRYYLHYQIIRKYIVLFLSIIFVCSSLQFMPIQAFAGQIPTAEPQMPVGQKGSISNGDYISIALKKFYSYFIEVPPGTGNLTIYLWDGDVGNGGAGDPYDIQRGGSWDTKVTYQVYSPAGGGAVITKVCDSGFDAICANNNWGTPLLNQGSPVAGHWEFRVNMATAQGADDTNGFAMRAYDNSVSGKELNVYADSYIVLGVRPNQASTTYPHLYPFITSGCTDNSNDFDFDSNGSYSLTSRTNSFTQTYTSPGGVSGDNAWKNNTFSGWNNNFWAADYGIWNTNFTVNGDDSLTYYIGNSAATPPPTSQPDTSGNVFRIYFPTYASGGTSPPVKPVMTQTLRHVSGPNPPANGSTTQISIFIAISNPTAWSITFSATNLVTANVPGSGAVYAGSASVSQGSIVSQPAIGGTGNITWNPGTVATGTTATLSYLVDVTPTAFGQTINVTGTPALSGTTARYVDETGSIYARATYTYGPLCQLAVTEGGPRLPTLAVISSFEAYEENGRVVVQWETASEIDTAGFYLFRKDNPKGEYIQLNEKLLPGLLVSPQGGTYRYVDDTAAPGNTYTYKLVEVETKGHNRTHGPFTVTVGKQGINTEVASTYLNYSRKAHDISDAKKARIEARKLVREATRSLTFKGRVRVPVTENGKAKIAVTEDGLYYLDASEISTLLGISTQNVISLIKMNYLSISNQGQKVPYSPANNNTGVSFYGQRNDSIYTKNNIYWLYQGSGLLMKYVKGSGPVPVNDDETFTEVLHFEKDRYAATSLFTNPETDYWLWDYIISGSPGSDTKTFNLQAIDVADVTSTATLTVNLKGGTDTSASPDHHAVISLNGTTIGEDRWEGTESHTLVLNFSQDLLYNGMNNVEVKGLLDTGAPYSIFHLNSFDLNYQRLYKAVANTLLCSGDGNPVVTITGFTNPDIMVFDVTDPQRPRFNKATTIDGTNGNYRVSFIPSSPDARYLAISVNASFTVTNAQADTPSGLKNRYNRADYLIITTQELLPAAESLANYRQQQGRQSMVVLLEDIMDEFNYGIYNPQAIRDFLSYAYHNWSKAPRYVVLAGEGTFDYKDNQGYGDNLIPPIMISTPQRLFPSDNQFADINGDHIPEMAVGRLPVVTSEELNAVIRKIISYESTNGDTGTKRVIMLAGNPDDGGDFPTDSNNVATLLPLGYTADKIYLSEHPIEEARQLLLYGINSGALIMNYIGHAGVDRLAQEGLLLTSDVASMTNLEKLPIVTAMTCVIGQFAIPGYDSLSEALLLKADGGAVAVWAPTGMSINSEAVILDEAFFQSAFESNRPALGDVVLKALKKGSINGVSDYILDIYNIMGDPALKLK